VLYQLSYQGKILVEREGFEPPKLSQLIYSQSHLAALEPLHIFTPDIIMCSIPDTHATADGADGRI